MKVRIYRPTKTAMQSGRANTKFWWVVPIEEGKTKKIDPVMGWTSSNDTKMQLKLKFKSELEAIGYAKSQGFEYELDEPEISMVKKKSYAENFTAPIH